MSVLEKIQEFLEQHLPSPEYFVVDVRLAGFGGGQKLTCLLDSDSSIGIDECAKVSRLLGAWIEAQDLLADAYILEVSTPGLDTPLKNIRQYKKNVGRQIKLKLTDKEVITGTLVEAADTYIVVEQEIKEKGAKIRKELVNYNFEHIAQAIIEPSFT